MTGKDGFVGHLTDGQKASLDALCKKLNVKLKEDEGLNGCSPIWGVEVSELTPENPTDLSMQAQVVLLKFLRARQFSVDKALDMLVACLKWRKEFNVAGLLGPQAETFPEALNSLGQVYGSDKDGSPVTYSYYGGIDVDSVINTPEQIRAFLRWRVQLMERAIALCDLSKGHEVVMQVHDYEGANMFKLGAGMKEATRSIIRLFQDNYPEWLSTKLFLNVPKVMEFVFGIMQAFSDPATRKKFCMVGTDGSRAKLLEYVDWSQLPPRMGGLSADVAGKGGEEVAGAESVSIKAGEPFTKTIQITEVAASGSYVSDGGATQKIEGQHDAFGAGKLEVTEPGKFSLTVSNTGHGYLWIDNAEVMVMVRAVHVKA